MSFLTDLAKKNRQEKALNAEVEGVPINLPGADGGLSSQFRDPYRVNGPLGSSVSAATRGRMQMIPQPTHNNRI